jgi:EF hand
MSVISRVVIVAVAAACLMACSSTRRAQVDLMDRSRDIFLLIRYDTNNDRQISKDEMEGGLKADYAKADTNGDGKLSPDEVQAENQRRWNLEGPQSSPLMDWNQDGNVSMAEFANAVHSLFTTVDKDTDDVVTVAELQAPRGTAAPKPPPLQPGSGTQQPMPGSSSIPSNAPGGTGGYPTR